MNWKVDDGADDRTQSRQRQMNEDGDCHESTLQERTRSFHPVSPCEATLYLAVPGDGVYRLRTFVRGGSRFVRLIFRWT